MLGLPSVVGHFRVSPCHSSGDTYDHPVTQPDDPTTTAPASNGSGDSGGDPFALIVAIYGAVVATGVAIYQFVRDRPGVKVKVLPLVLLKQPRIGLEGFWSITVVNHRKRGITIQGAGLFVDGKVRSFPSLIDANGERTESPFPVKLNDGAMVQIYANRGDGDSKVSGAWATDALGRDYTVRYPSRNPVAQLKAWRYRRAFEKGQKEHAVD